MRAFFLGFPDGPQCVLSAPGVLEWIRNVGGGEERWGRLFGVLFLLLLRGHQFL